MRLLDGSSQVRRMDSKFLRSHPCHAGSERLSSVSGECPGALSHRWLQPQ